jgi:hypothetical protein
MRIFWTRRRRHLETQDELIRTMSSCYHAGNPEALTAAFYNVIEHSDERIPDDAGKDGPPVYQIIEGPGPVS